MICGEIKKSGILQIQNNFTLLKVYHHDFVDEDRGLLDEKLPCLNYGIIAVSDTNDV